MTKYHNNLTTIIADIERVRVQFNSHHIVKIVAVSKYSSSKDIEELYRAGQRAFGENKIQDLIKKQQDLSHLPLEWHFIGRLQKNKINALIEANVSLLHSLNSIELANEIDKRLKIKNKKLDVLLQVNSSYESSKTGFNPDKLEESLNLISSRYKNINIKGLMSIGAHTQDQQKLEKSFQITNKLFKKVQSDNISILSMGMSSDYNQAILNGSNMIRVGSLLFK